MILGITKIRPFPVSDGIGCGRGGDSTVFESAMPMMTWASNNAANRLRLAPL